MNRTTGERVGVLAPASEGVGGTSSCAGLGSVSGMSLFAMGWMRVSARLAVVLRGPESADAHAEPGVDVVNFSGNAGG